MIQIGKTVVSGFEPAIRGMRNPMNSWDKSDSVFWNDGDVELGDNDYALMKNLAKSGTDHRKYMRMVVVYADVNAPLYWWKEYDTYKVGTVANSCSTMHKIQSKKFVMNDFSHDKMNERSISLMFNIIDALNYYREKFKETKDKEYWWQMIQLLPESYNQNRTIMLNYEVLANIYHSRKNHKLDEWRDFCRWIEKLPYAEFITGEYEDEHRQS